MMEQIAKWVLIAIVSTWASVYVGSLAPQLWRQRNYRGAIGVVILASIVLVLPIVLSIYRKGN